MTVQHIDIHVGEASAWQTSLGGDGRRSITVVVPHPGGKRGGSENPRPESWVNGYYKFIRRQGGGNRYGIVRFVNLFNCHAWEIDAGEFTQQAREDTDRVLRAFAAGSDDVLCAWGDGGYRAGIPRGDDALAILREWPNKLYFLGLNGSGHPRGLRGSQRVIVPWVSAFDE